MVTIRARAYKQGNQSQRANNVLSATAIVIVIISTSYPLVIKHGFAGIKHGFAGIKHGFAGKRTN